jgi:hypothetical protein
VPDRRQQVQSQGAQEDAQDTTAQAPVSPQAREATGQAGDAAVRRMAGAGQPQTAEQQPIERTVDGVRIYAPAGVNPAAVDRAAELVQLEVGRNLYAQRRFAEQHIGLIIIPAHEPMTDMPQLHGLQGGHTTDGTRTWNTVRGEGSARLPDGTFACAVGEEQLVDVPGVLRNYAAGYSVGMHEFAHTLNLHAMTREQKETVTRLYQARHANDPDNGKGTWTDDYASHDEQEYFAQATNCFFGRNQGAYNRASLPDHPYTENKNGREWLQQNDPEMYAFLVTLYEHDYDREGHDQTAAAGPGH